MIVYSTWLDGIDCANPSFFCNLSSGFHAPISICIGLDFLSLTPFSTGM